MSTEVGGRARAEARPAAGDAPDDKGYGWLVFAGVMVLLVGTLNVIYGIAAISDSKFFVNNAEFMFSTLNTWGWVVLVLGVLQIFAAFSIWQGGGYGRWFGIGIACLSAIGALLSIPAYPFWSLSIFAIDLLIIYGLAAYGGHHRFAR